jgi:hypothetical protein
LPIVRELPKRLGGALANSDFESVAYPRIILRSRSISNGLPRRRLGTESRNCWGGVGEHPAGDEDHLLLQAGLHSLHLGVELDAGHVRHHQVANDGIESLSAAQAV